MKKSFPLSKVYTLLGSGPTVLISSKLAGRPNVMPIAWLTPIDFNPPIIGCCIGSHSYTHEIVKKTREFVINIPSSDMAKEVLACGHATGRKIDKFAKTGLTPVKASKVAAPIIDECFVNLECKVTDTSLIKKYDLFVAEVVAAWIRPSKKMPKTLHHITGNKFIVSGKII